MINADGFEDTVRNPLNAIYTPFSIILFYEIYSLVYYLPKSMSIHMGKQFEIITLIVIRSLFDDLAKLNFSQELHTIVQNPQYLYSIATVLVLFFLILMYYRLNKDTICRINNTSIEITKKNQSYFLAKKLLAVIVGIIFFIMFLYFVFETIRSDYTSIIGFIEATKDSSKVFFDKFFIVLILSDVLILLFSFNIMDDFHKVIRNSAYVISTTLLMLSFTVKGLTSQIIILVAVIFSTLILLLYKQYAKTELLQDV